MNKKAFISFILLSAFSFLIAHNIIPHHHHNDKDDVAHYSHYNHDKHSHEHHDKKNEDDKQKEGHKDEPVSHYFHSNTLFTHAELSSSKIEKRCSKKFLKILKWVFEKKNQYTQLKIPLPDNLLSCFEHLISPPLESDSRRGPPSIA